MSAPDTIFAATKTKASAEAINYAIDMSRLLKGSELYTGLPVISAPAGQTLNGMTFGVPSVNAAPFTDDYGNNVPIGCGVLVLGSGGNPGATVEALVSCGTTAGNTRVGGLRIFIER